MAIAAIPPHTVATDTELEPLAQLAIDHLERESDLITNVIASCEQLNQFLRRPTANPNRQTSTPETPDSDKDIESDIHTDTDRPSAIARIQEMQARIDESFAPIRADRARMALLLKNSRTPDCESPPLTLSRLASAVADPLRHKLRQQQSGLKKKLREFQTIMMGNQLVLAYDLDFSQRLIAGVTGIAPAAPGYNATGQRAHANNPSLLQKNC